MKEFFLHLPCSWLGMSVVPSEELRWDVQRIIQSDRDRENVLICNLPRLLSMLRPVRQVPGQC